MQSGSLLKRYVHATAASIMLSGAPLTTADLPAKAENLPSYMAPIAGTTSSSAAATAATDSLVGWAWAPGYGRQPAPGTQKEFGALIDAWMKTGAVCPS